MPQERPTTLYDALGRPLFNRALNEGLRRGIRYGIDQYAASSAPQATAAVAGGESSLGSLGGTSWSSYAPYLALAAPLIQTYSAYTGGSGRNEPLEKRRYTDLRGRLLSDLLAGKKIDWSNTENEYGVKPKELSREISGLDPENANQMVDPRGWTAKELYDDMLSQSSQFYQTGGVGNSGYTGNQINARFGNQQKTLAEALGLTGLPDWNQHDKGSGFSPGYETGRAYEESRQTDMRKASGLWDKLSPEERLAYGNLSAGEKDPFGIFQNDLAVKDINDKYKTGLKTYAERMAEKNQRF